MDNILETPFWVADMFPKTDAPAQNGIKFCNRCGASDLVKMVPEGDNRIRVVCQACGVVHYQDPKIVTGCIATYNDKILLGRRNIEPRTGFWSLPSGYLEPGESTLRSAAREAREETNASVNNLELYCVFEMPQINHLYLIFKGDLRVPVAFPGDESVEVGFFSSQSMPWEKLAFPTEYQALKTFFKEVIDGSKSQLHAAEFFWDDGENPKISMQLF